MPRADCLERLVPPPGPAVPWKAKKEAPFWVWTQGADGFCFPRYGQRASWGPSNPKISYFFFPPLEGNGSRSRGICSSLCEFKMRRCFKVPNVINDLVLAGVLAAGPQGPILVLSRRAPLLQPAHLLLLLELGHVQDPDVVTKFPNAISSFAISLSAICPM